ncbi:hypothetical protein TUM17379_08740 [Shewanella algae]|uniref:NADPH-dependent FMN reductase-like domain-containing protein n=1 Tax=Shewanella algae TaxID=38313 RepID=A0AAD1K8E6_9GAMM|nr:NAD(P)H-dependent oxidoreductase [Shewanella algae]BCV43856.1 hypothetical protein TUM17379_08740 [Shewanella algae]
MQQLRIKFISGSLRKGSFNTRLARYAAAVAAELGLESEVLTLNAFPMPLLNQDDEAEFGAPKLPWHSRESCCRAIVWCWCAPNTMAP